MEPHFLSPNSVQFLKRCLLHVSIPSFPQTSWDCGWEQKGPGWCPGPCHPHRPVEKRTNALAVRRAAERRGGGQWGEGPPPDHELLAERATGRHRVLEDEGQRGWRKQKPRPRRRVRSRSPWEGPTRTVAPHPLHSPRTRCIAAALAGPAQSSKGTSMGTDRTGEAPPTLSDTLLPRGAAVTHENTLESAVDLQEFPTGVRGCKIRKVPRK